MYDQLQEGGGGNGLDVEKDGSLSTQRELSIPPGILMVEGSTLSLQSLTSSDNVRTENGDDIHIIKTEPVGQVHLILMAFVLS